MTVEYETGVQKNAGVAVIAFRVAGRPNLNDGEIYLFDFNGAISIERLANNVFIENSDDGITWFIVWQGDGVTPTPCLVVAYHLTRLRNASGGFVNATYSGWMLSTP